MKDKILQFIQDLFAKVSGRSDIFKEGAKDSMMRYLSLSCCRFGFVYGFIALFHHPEVTGNDVTIILGVITIGVTGKAYQKGKELTSHEVGVLRKKALIEGRKPNVHISASVAAKTGQGVDYMKQRGIDNDYCRTMILDSLKKFQPMSRGQFEEIIAGKLSENLTDKQKSDKVRNVLQMLRREGLIWYQEEDRLWRLNDSAKDNQPG